MSGLTPRTGFQRVVGWIVILGLFIMLPIWLLRQSAPVQRSGWAEQIVVSAIVVSAWNAVCLGFLRLYSRWSNKRTSMVLAVPWIAPIFAVMGFGLALINQSLTSKILVVVIAVIAAELLLWQRLYVELIRIWQQRLHRQ